MATVVTSYFKQKIAEKDINLSTDNFYISLLSALTNCDCTVSAWSAVSANEITSNNYSAASLSGKNLLVNSCILQWD